MPRSKFFLLSNRQQVYSNMTATSHQSVTHEDSTSNTCSLPRTTTSHQSLSHKDTITDACFITDTTISHQSASRNDSTTHSFSLHRHYIIINDDKCIVSIILISHWFCPPPRPHTRVKKICPQMQVLAIIAHIWNANQITLGNQSTGK
jgi:hypothetical protein